MTDNCRAAKCLRLFSLQEEEDEQRTVFFYFVTEGQSRVERPTHTHISVDDIRQRDVKV